MKSTYYVCKYGACIQANEKSSGFQEGAYRDGVKREETSQG